MKRFVSFVLIFVLAFALCINAYAASQTKPNPTTNDAGLEIYNSKDELIAVVPAKEVTKYLPSRAGLLDASNKEAFLKAYEEAKNVKDKVVRQFFWLDIPDKYKNLNDFAYAKFPFTSKGKNVQLTVNGKEMEVISEGGVRYFAKLTEFGTVCITSD